MKYRKHNLQQSKEHLDSIASIIRDCIGFVLILFCAFYASVIWITW